MSLPRDTILFGIALVVFAAWLETSGMGGWPFAVAGIFLAALGFLASVGSAMQAGPETAEPIDDDAS